MSKIPTAVNFESLSLKIIIEQIATQIGVVETKAALEDTEVYSILEIQVPKWTARKKPEQTALTIWLLLRFLRSFRNLSKTGTVRIRAANESLTAAIASEDIF